MRWYRRRGQSLVEFALIIPILVAVFLLIMDGAFIVQGLLTVNHVARSTARFATTYQPPQGECYYFKDESISPDCSPGEDDSAYYERRVRLIKKIARMRTLGLRISIECSGDDSNACIAEHKDDSGMWGVKVWGIHSFTDPVTLENMPGLPGLPVQVQVVHRVPLVAASIFMAEPSVLVQGTSQMINEGVQTLGDGSPPPVIAPPPDIDPPDEPPPTVDPGGGDPGGGDPPPDDLPPMTVELNPPTALNTLPMEREHIFEARVTSDGQPVPGKAVRFTTTAGSFAYSGSSAVRVKTLTTDVGGYARIAIYSNEPATAIIEAWADGGKVGVKETSEYDQSTKTWVVTGPYLVLSDHNPEAGAVIAANLRDHDPTMNPYDLWWCPNLSDPTTVNISAQVDSGINVDGGGDASDRPVQVPATAMGTYYIESHYGSGGCGNPGDFVARSADIKIKLPNPDLHISAVNILGPVEAKRAPGVPLTLTVSVQNLQPVAVTTGPFDVDVYPNLDEPPYLLQLSAEKQWVATIGPNATVVLTYVVSIEDVGTNHLWAQVDTTNYIEEEDETNNIFGPVDFEACVGSDDFDAGLKTVWSTGQYGDANGNAAVNGNGELAIMNKGSNLMNPNDNYFYVYQAYPGDFDARLRIIGPPRIADYSKIGLHVRAALDRKSNYVMNMAMNRTTGYNPASSQMVHRTGTKDGARVEDDRVVNLPYWVRIVRKGTTYSFFSSEEALPNSEADWRPAGSIVNNTPMPFVGIAHANYNWQTPSEGIVDDFMICPAEFTLGPGGGGDDNPPGLIECEELLNVRGFEGNNATVFSYWHAGNVGAFRLTSQQRYRGNFSMRLHASLGAYPCSQNSLQPELYQDIQVPTTLYSITKLFVTGHYFVDGSDMECSNPNSPDPNDTLSVKLLELNGDQIAAPQTIIDGGVVSRTWHTMVTTVTDAINLESYAGETVRLQWNGNHTGDYDGTYFYLDDLSAQMCTLWPIPDPIDGTVSLGGKLTTRISGGTLRVALTGADVWAYTQNGEIYHTTSIQDGSYHFYNLPQAGTYIVYSEATVDGQLRTAVASVTLNPGERNYNINLFLQ
ncbi:MAG: pilus assembly protein [Anaerolineae bacterium]|nr:pilus assembly protein [Anaerolineae bacterium]